MRKFKTAVADKLPLRSLRWEQFLDLIGKAEEAVGHFQALIESVPHPDKIFAVLKTEEAIASLRLEKTPLQLLLKEEEEAIHSYLLAQKNAEKAVKSRPISETLLRKIHTDLYKDSQAPKNDIGQFRKRQNWIGREGCKIEEATYRPPKAALIPKELKNWKSYIRYPEKNSLVQLAILFAQLLVIHPFMDGNGRIARMLVPLFLWKKGLISHPLFFISAYLKKHRPLYFRTLFAISDEKDWEGWIRFFLTTLIHQGKRNNKKIEKIIKLYTKVEQQLLYLHKPKKAQQILHLLFAHPILDEEKISCLSLESFKMLKRGKFLKRKAGAQKRIWIFAPLIRLLQI